MRQVKGLVVVVLAVSCGTMNVGTSDAGLEDSGTRLDAGNNDAGTGPDASTADASTADASTADASIDASIADAAVADASVSDAGVLDAGYDAGVRDGGPADAGRLDAGSVDAGTWKTSLRNCWTQASCQRVLAVAHGGLWDAVSKPYDSNAALTNAFTNDFDGVKIDVRVTADNVPVISHSSPIQTYESLDCTGRVIETSTAAQVTACHRFPSTSETFQRLDDVLAWLRGKMVVELTVKRPQDFQRTVTAIHAAGAEDYAFIEVNPGDVQTFVTPLTNAQDIYFLVNIASDLSQVAPMLARNDPRLFMYEFDPTVNVATITMNQLHPAGVKTFTYDNSSLLSASQAQGYFQNGFDAVSANVISAKQARVTVNQSRGISPP